MVLNSIINTYFNNALVNVSKNNSSLYNSDIKLNSGNKFNWCGNTVYEVSNNILSKFINDGSPFTSKRKFNFNWIQNADSSLYRLL